MRRHASSWDLAWTTAGCARPRFARPISCSPYAPETGDSPSFGGAAIQQPSESRSTSASAPRFGGGLLDPPSRTCQRRLRGRAHQHGTHNLPQARCSPASMAGAARHLGLGSKTTDPPASCNRPGQLQSARSSRCYPWPAMGPSSAGRSLTVAGLSNLQKLRHGDHGVALAPQLLQDASECLRRGVSGMHQDDVPGRQLRQGTLGHHLRRRQLPVDGVHCPHDRGVSTRRH